MTDVYIIYLLYITYRFQILIFYYYAHCLENSSLFPFSFFLSFLNIKNVSKGFYRNVNTFFSTVGTVELIDCQYLVVFF